MNSAYNQMQLDEQPRQLTQFVIGNQQYEFNRFFYGISIVPAAFSAAFTAPDKSHSFLTRVKFLGHIIERNSITP